MALALTEGGSAVYSATLNSEDSTGISSTQLTTLTLTHYDRETGTIINARSSQNVLNTNDVTLSTAGALSWDIREEDAIIVNPFLPVGAAETHIGLFLWTWGSSSTKTGQHEAVFTVTQRAKV